MELCQQFFKFAKHFSITIIMNKNKKGKSVGFRPQETTKKALDKAAHREDRSISYIVERAVRRDLGLDRK